MPWVSDTRDVDCPYCQSAQDIYHDDGYGYDEGVTYQQECAACEKTFTYTTSISFRYKAERANCLNGSDHEWKPALGLRNAGYQEANQCCNCEAEIPGPWTQPDWMKEGAQ